MNKMCVPEVPELFFVALCVWAGHYGNGSDRTEQLKEAGYDPEKVQSIVNAVGAVFKMCEE